MTITGIVILVVCVVLSGFLAAGAWSATYAFVLEQFGVRPQHASSEQQDSAGRWAWRAAGAVLVPALVGSVFIGLAASDHDRASTAKNDQVRAAITAKYGIPVDPAQVIPSHRDKADILGRVDGQPAECTLRVVDRDPLVLCDANKVWRESDRPGQGVSGLVESDRPGATSR